MREPSREKPPGKIKNPLSATEVDQGVGHISGKKGRDAIQGFASMGRTAGFRGHTGRAEEKGEGPKRISCNRAKSNNGGDRGDGSARGQT